MNVPNTNFTIAGTLDELKAKGRLVLHGAHRPILVVYDRGNASLRSTTGARTWASHSIAAASRTGS